MNDVKPGAMVCATIEGHQIYREVVGEVVMWGHTARPFNEGKITLQVPCVVLLVSDPYRGFHTQVIPLIGDCEHTTVTPWRNSATEKPNSASDQTFGGRNPPRGDLDVSGRPRPWLDRPRSDGQ